MKPGPELPDPNEPVADTEAEFPEDRSRLALHPRFSPQSLVGSPVPQTPALSDSGRILADPGRIPPAVPDPARVLPADPAPVSGTPRGFSPVPDAAPGPGSSPILPALGPGSVLCPRCRGESPAGAEFCERCGLSFLETRAIEGTSLVPAPSATALVGQTINGKYRVLSVLGEGGFGVVYKVELLLFDRANIFALKLLHPTLSQDNNFRRRFLREAGLALTLIHENTIQIREFGQTDDGHLFFTMDYCQGEPLKEVISREGFLTVPRALHVTRQMLSVLKLAHARGILHRDLKPENIFLEKSPGRDFVKVGDFGLAKSFEPVPEAGTPRGRLPRLPGEDITRGGIVGTPRYMSPEQALGKEDLDQRSDLFAVGVILYEMLYGHVPPERIVGAGTVSPPLKTPTAVPGHVVPRDVWGIIRKALEVRREDRYQSADEFLQAVEGLPAYTPMYGPAARGRSRTRIFFARVAFLALAAGVIWLSSRLLTDFHGKSRKGEPGLSHSEAQGSSPVAAGPGSKAVVPAGPAPTDLEARARTLEPARLSPFPREGVLAFLKFKKGDVLRYDCYREGLVYDRDVMYTVADVRPGAFVFKVTPGDRTVTWIVNEAENELYQDFPLPDPETGELTQVGHRLWLKLPRPDAVIDGDFIDKDLRVHAQRVDLTLPARHPRTEALTGCLRVESREDDRTHYHYYKEGKGLVAIEVYEMRSAKPPVEAAPGQPAAAKIASPPPATSQAIASAPGAANGKAVQVLVYARYLVEG